MTADFIQVELFAIFIAVGISVCIWGVWKFIYALVQEDKAEVREKMQIVIDTRQCPCRTLNDECDISGHECYEDDIFSSCPLIMNGGVKLPKGHGELVDIRPLMRGLYEEMRTGELTYTTSEVYKMLDDETTIIIEADGR